MTDNELILWLSDQWKAAVAERDALAEDVEQLRVQLAGCSVIAGSNTKDSLARAMPGKDAYGYSASLADVERCVRREIALRTERDALVALLREAREELSMWMYYGHATKASGYGSGPLCNRIDAALAKDKT